MRIKWLRLKEHIVNLSRVDAIRLDGKMIIISIQDYKVITVNYISDEEAAKVFVNLQPILESLYRD